jgi:hypothetical protein
MGHMGMNPKERERHWFKDSKKTSPYYGEVVYVVELTGSDPKGWRYDVIWLSPSDDSRKEFFPAVVIDFNPYRAHRASEEEYREAVMAAFEEKK